MLSRTDTAGHANAFHYPVMGHWGGGAFCVVSHYKSLWVPYLSLNSFFMYLAPKCSPNFLYIPCSLVVMFKDNIAVLSQEIDANHRGVICIVKGPLLIIQSWFLNIITMKKLAAR